MKRYQPDKPKSAPLKSTVASRASECPQCKEVFNGITTFDKHLQKVPCKIDKYRMECRDPESKGLALNARGYWAEPGGDEWWNKNDSV